MNARITLAMAVAFAILASAPAKGQDATKDDKNLNAYLVDVSPGPVAAGTIVGLNGSSITEVQSAKDLVLALSPFSTKDSKSGYGLAITPARTAVMPMAGSTYTRDPGGMGGVFNRLVGSTTLSYAENTANVSGNSYRKSAVSVASVLYLDAKRDDPVFLGYDSFVECRQLDAVVQVDLLKANQELARAQTPQERAAAQAKVDAALKRATEITVECAKNKKYTTRWNASKVSMSFGQGWIKPESGGSRLSLGKRLTLSGIFAAGSDSAVYAVLQRVSGEVDLSTLAGTPSYQGSTIMALRYAKDVPGNGNQRMLAEVSNAKSTKDTAANAAYKYALGVDQKIFDGMWLELRVGRKRSVESGKDESVALFNVNWAPAPQLFEK